MIGDIRVYEVSRREMFSVCVCVDGCIGLCARTSFVVLHTLPV